MESRSDFDLCEYDERIDLAHWLFGINRKYEHNFKMIVRRKFVTSLLVLALLFTEACNKKKPVPPPRTLAPTIAVELPEEIPENPETPAPEVAQVPIEQPPVKTKPKKAPRTTTKKTTPPVSAQSAAATPSPTNNSQTVAGLRPPRNPGSETPPDTAIAAAMPSAAITRQKEDTAQIVDATENSLKNLSRQLNDEEKTMKTQIQSYLQQSRKATTDGDFERAFNLAKKAQLLAEALIKK
jgi:ElaB/YqjD/DUF883 family membrane-anchored ribosome-binding protein